MFIVFCDRGVCAQDSKARYEFEPKITCSKIFIFQPILEFQKYFHYTKANTVKLLFSDCTICKISLFHFSQAIIIKENK
jgi:hypothetical protein